MESEAVVVQPVKEPVKESPWTPIKGALLSEQAIVVYATIILFIFRWLGNRKTLDDQRWGGLIAHVYNAAEKAGLKTGNEKLDKAILLFGEEFVKVYGKAPTKEDVQDAKLDLAKLARDSKP